MKTVRNLFVEHTEATRYNEYRPIYHDLPFQKVYEYFGKKLGSALDVACGTGHSTRAMAKVCGEIIGCDASEGMLAEARRSSPLEYVHARAEELPFDDDTFDYVNISQGVQWTDQPKFFSEVRRVLKATGHFSIDNYGFKGTMLGNDEFIAAYKKFDNDHMKPVPRNKNYPDESETRAFGFEQIHRIEYSHEVQMSQGQFTNYLMTRSNFLELSPTARTEAERLMHEFYRPYFDGEAKTLLFAGAMNLYGITK